MDDSRLEDFWRAARRALRLPADTPVPEAWAFGDSPQMADELLTLALAGTKTATTGALCDYQAERDPLPVVGDLSIVLDGGGRPACVIETTEVRVLPMSQVDAAFAYEEGEGDRSLASWSRAHEAFFRRHLPTRGLEYAPDMPVVLERFVVRYPRG